MMLESYSENLEDEYDYQNNMLIKLAFKTGVAVAKVQSKRGLKYKDLEDKKPVKGESMSIEEHNKLKEELDKRFNMPKEGE